MPEPMDHSENMPRPGPAEPVAPATAPPADLPGTTAGEGGTAAPETGDLVVDAALRDLAAVDDADLDATLVAGESVHRTLTSRLSDLGS